MLKEALKILSNPPRQTERRDSARPVIKFQMEGDFGKLTPFQETVNTYIKTEVKKLLNK